MPQSFIYRATSSIIVFPSCKIILVCLLSPLFSARACMSFSRLMPSSFTTHLDRIIIRWQELCGHVQSVLTRSPLPARAERRTGRINFPSGFTRAGENTSHSRCGGDLVPSRFMRPLNPKTSARRCDLRLVAV